MKTWDEYKEHVKAVDPVMGKEIEIIEEMTAIISAIPEQPKVPDISQRELASRCGIPAVLASQNRNR